MEQSTNYNFNLPSKNDETSADIDLISDNFRTVDDVVKQVQDDVSKIPTNLVNGSAEGSLRSVDAQEEDENYKMGDFAVALGQGAMAIGESSFAEGVGTCAEGYGSHAEGMFTVAKRNNQHVQGVANIVDEEDRYAHIVGNGNPGVYNSNAHTLDWDGNAWFAGDVYVGGTSQDDESATKLSGVATDITQVKEKLDGIEEGANKTVVDSELSTTSTNPVQNKVVSEKIKNHASFLARGITANTVYINLGKFTGDNSGGKAIITISGHPYWGGKEAGGFRVLTLSSNSYSDISSTDIHTGASLYDFGKSNYAGTEIVDDPYNIQVALVRPNGYSVAEVDVYLKFNNYQYNSYLVTVDYSDGCSWVTSTEKVTTSDPDPMENALSAFIVPKRQFADLTKLKTKADVETGNCTLSASNGTVSNATYSVVGNMVTLNFNIAPPGAGNVVVSGLPFTATKNQSGFASSTATYNITANQTSVSINSTSGTAEYCTVTYLK